MATMFSTVLVLVVLGSGTAIAAGTSSPYTGLEKREIKALSSDEVEAYLGGKGMGLAKAAELNHYPGPAHVLAMSNALALTHDQQMRTESLFKSMETEAILLGHQLIAREAELDGIFADQTITKERLQQSTAAIATLQGQIRRVHLQTHLAQVEILDPEQIRQYDKLRGYFEATDSSLHENAQPHH